MPKREFSDGQSNFGRGINTLASPKVLGAGEVVELTNAFIDPNGSVFRRPGYQRTMGSWGGGGSIFDVFSVVNPSKATGIDVIVLIWGSGTTTVYYVSSANPMTSFPWTLTSAGSFAEISQPTYGYEYVEMKDGSGNDCVYFSNPTVPTNTNVLRKLVLGAGAPTVSSITTPTGVNPVFLTPFNNRLFSCEGNNATNKRNYLSYSAQLDGSTLGDAANGGGQVQMQTPGQICALLPVGSSLFILHTSGIFRFSGYTSDDIAISSLSVSQTGGITFPPYILPAVISLGLIGYFTDDAGHIYQIDEAGNVTLLNKNGPFVPNPISNVAEPIFGSGRQMPRPIYDAFHQTIMWMASNYGTSHYLAYNTVTGGWSRNLLTGAVFCGHVCSANALFTRDQYSKQIFFVENDGGIRYPCLWRRDATKDQIAADGTGGVEPTFTLKTREFVAKSVLSTKALRNVWVTYKNNATATPTVSVNGVACTADTIISPTRQYPVPAIDPSPAFQVTISDTSMPYTERIVAISLEGFIYGNRF